MEVLSPQTDGPLAGWPVLDIETPLLLAYVAACERMGVQYGFGAKDPNPGQWPPDVSEIDCSGFVRAALAYSTNGQSIRAGMPDGSFAEADWFASTGFKRTNYQNAGLGDGHVRVAAHHPGGTGGDPIGHIWLIHNGMSIESYGGNGPGRRPWNHQWFLDHVDVCFVLS